MSTESLFILTFWILGSLREFEIFGEILIRNSGNIFGRGLGGFGEFGERKPSEIWFFSEGIYFFCY
jgi:hypothetical protein